MKYILVIGDGMADNHVPELGGKTPLQYANIPALDALADAGIIGSVKTVPDGLPPGSDTAILSIFGCDPRECYTGRAPLEAAATGIELSPGDVAYRCNMIALEDAGIPFEQKKILSHSAGGIDGETSDALIGALFDMPEFKAAAQKAGVVVHPANSFRHIAVQKTPDIKGLKLTPPHDHLGEVIGGYLPRGCKNAEILADLMSLAHKLLDSHPVNEKRRKDGKLPANGIWFWAEGTAVKLPCFTDKYGKTGGVISAVPLCQGIAALIGLERIYVEGATGELDTNYEGKADAVFEVLKNHDFAAVHIEAPDECTHNGDTAGKLQAIERIDSRVISPIVEKLTEAAEDFRMLILSDHKTLTETRGHDGTPVPYILYDSRFNRKTGAVYCEADCEMGRYIDEGIKLMEILFKSGAV